MAYWLKELSDRTLESGYDIDLEEGKASWSKGRQDIIKATITLEKWSLSLCSAEGNGLFSTWEQKDHYVASMASGQSVRFKRELTCTVNNYSSMNIVTSAGGTNMIISLCNDGVIKIPPSTVKISTCLDLSGSFSYQFVK